jgi:hypothetical protein
MSILSPILQQLLSRVLSRRAHGLSAQIKQTAAQPFAAQEATLHFLVAKAKNTQFGQEHGFASIRHYKDLEQRVPLRDYEALKPYINKIIAGQPDILWPGRPLYFAYTSGTTSGTKYIPISRDFLKPYIRSGSRALSLYIAETRNVDCLAGKLVYFTDNRALDRFHGIPVRPIAGICQAQLPRFVRRRFLPSDATNRPEDFETEIAVAVEETLGQKVTMISGIPPWIQLYFNRLIDKTGKRIKEIFPHLSVLVHGGVSIEPYRANLEASIGAKIDTIETYPASEGFIAFQDAQHEPGLLLNLHNDTFYEFVPVDELSAARPTRVALQDVELEVQYAIILHTSAGLWGYILGDTVKFVSKQPYRLVVTGRSSHFLSTTGEHLIAADVESALAEALRDTGLRAVEFTVAPQMHPASGLPYHEWFIEFADRPPDLSSLALKLNALMEKQNVNYEEFCQTGIMLPLKIQVVRQGGFAQYMKSIGKLGGQHKVPHLSNDRRIAEALTAHVVATNVMA